MNGWHSNCYYKMEIYFEGIKTMGKKHKMRLEAAFGVTEEGIIDVPKKISNVQIARIEHGEDRGCSFCFPHGIETSNSTLRLTGVLGRIIE